MSVIDKTRVGELQTRTILDLVGTKHTQSLQLLAESTLADHKLCSIGTVQAIDTVRSRDTVLNLRCVVISISIVEETRRGKDFLRDNLKITNDIPASSLGRSAHIESLVHDLLVLRQGLVQEVYAVLELIEQLGFTWGAFSRLDEVQDVDGAPVSFEQVVEMQRSRLVERVVQTQVDVGLWGDSCVVLRPV